ncbi:Ribonuclease 3 [Sphingomonas antarctica]|uniref:ribonuclease III n=1 Tax=Sphingomonas antarctica TaxID=2040274 RepID=UPI0039E91C38
MSWLAETLGAEPRDATLYQTALTHPSHGADNYQRLEFLGDRVLGLVIADWLSALFPRDREGELSHRFVTLVSGATCADVARDLGLRGHVRLGKQARDDGAADSDNILGDVIEALIGALYQEHGLQAARAFIHRAWASRIDGKAAVPRHPKSLLHEWAEGHKRKPPTYTVIDRSGPDHALRWTVRASLGTAGEADGTGSSKQEAETAAATALLGMLSL